MRPRDSECWIKSSDGLVKQAKRSGKTGKNNFFEKNDEKNAKKFGGNKKVIYLCNPFPTGRGKFIDNTER